MKNILDLAAKASHRYFGRGLLIARKYAPEILTGLGIVGGAATVVMAARATLDLEPVMTDLEVKLANRKDVRKNTSADEYSSMEYSKDLAKIYAEASLEIAKIYSPAFVMGVASTACILGAHGIMQRRNAALVVAYEAAERAYAAYRKRVIEEFGEDKDRDYRYGVVDGSVHTVTDEDGTKHRVTDADIVGSRGASLYAKFFDETNVNWTKSPDANLNFLLCQQKWMNDLLEARGHVLLNDVYDSIGIPRTPAGAVVGWVKDNPKGDGYIDFHIHELDNTQKRAFVNGFERSILLDFNVDGVVYELI